MIDDRSRAEADQQEEIAQRAQKRRASLVGGSEKRLEPQKERKGIFEAVELFIELCAADCDRRLQWELEKLDRMAEDLNMCSSMLEGEDQRNFNI